MIDPTNLLPPLPPVLVHLFHWVVLAVYVLVVLSMVLSFVWAYIKDSYVSQYRKPFPVTKVTKWFDFVLTLCVNIPHYMNKIARSKGLPTPFKFDVGDLEPQNPPSPPASPSV